MHRVAAFLLLLPIVAACGAARSSDPGLDDASDNARAAGSARISISYGGRTFFSGEFDFERGVGAFAWGEQDKGGQWDQIMTRDATYSRFRPEDLGGPSVGSVWTKSSASEVGDPIFGIFPSDPVRLLGTLKAASNVQKLETEEVRGIKVVRYRARLDLERALEALGGPGGYAGKLRATIRQFWVDGAGEGIPLELAVEENGLLRRVDVEIPDGDRLSVEFYDYGIEVGAKRPPASEIISMEEFVRMMSELCAKGDDGGERLEISCGEVRLGIEERE